MRRDLFIGLALVASCTPSGTSEQLAVKASNAYLDANGLTRFGEGRRVAVRDEGTEWAVVYRTPQGAAGGDFIVFVDKRTMKALGHVGFQ
jgi:hypothetical protein